MDTSNVKQAKRMHFGRRDVRFVAPSVPIGYPLLPRTVFAQVPELAAAYDEMVRYNDAIRDHTGKALAARAAIDQASRDYKAAVSKAVLDGKDAAAVHNDAPKQEALAEHHEQVAHTATLEAKAHGHVLGRLLSEHAVDLVGPSDEALEAAGKQLGKALDGMATSWAAWSEAWAVRSALSTARFSGGSNLGVARPTALPREVADAVAVLRDHLDHLERLRSDEAEIERWRAEQ